MLDPMQVNAIMQERAAEELQQPTGAFKRAQRCMRAHRQGYESSGEQRCGRCTGAVKVTEGPPCPGPLGVNNTIQ